MLCFLYTPPARALCMKPWLLFRCSTCTTQHYFIYMILENIKFPRVQGGYEFSRIHSTTFFVCTLAKVELPLFEGGRPVEPFKSFTRFMSIFGLQELKFANSIWNLKEIVAPMQVISVMRSVLSYFCQNYFIGVNIIIICHCLFQSSLSYFTSCQRLNTKLWRNLAIYLNRYNYLLFFFIDC